MSLESVDNNDWNFHKTSAAASRYMVSTRKKLSKLKTSHKDSACACIFVFCLVFALALHLKYATD